MPIGHDIYRIDYKVGFLTIFSNVIVYCEFYTVSSTALTSLDDFKYALQSISVIALPSQVYVYITYYMQLNHIVLTKS